MRFTSLGSGSQGNALIVEAGSTRVMLDCGLGLNDVKARLTRRGLEAADIDAIVVTHEHDDHIGGVARFSRKFEIPVYMTHGTLSALDGACAGISRLTVVNSHTPFAIGDIEVRPYPVPHDAREPAQFVFSDGRFRLGVLTDAGCSTPHIENMLSGLEALVLECNHDAGMLANSNYPPYLRQRIAGRYGHLDNSSAAGLLARLDRSRLQHVIAAHLSQQNNTPVLARQALAGALGCEEDWIEVADQRTGFDWRALS